MQRRTRSVENRAGLWGERQEECNDGRQWVRETAPCQPALLPFCSFSGARPQPAEQTLKSGVSVLTPQKDENYERQSDLIVKAV